MLTGKTIASAHTYGLFLLEEAVRAMAAWSPTQREHAETAIDRHFRALAADLGYTVTRPAMAAQEAAE